MQEINKQTINVFIVLLYTTVTIWFQIENINYEVNARSLWELYNSYCWHVTTDIIIASQVKFFIMPQTLKCTRGRKEEFEDTVTINFRSDDFNLTNRNPWFSSFLVSTYPLSRKSWYEPQTLEYRINWKMYTPYADAAGMLLNGKFTIGKLKSSLLS